MDGGMAWPQAETEVAKEGNEAIVEKRMLKN
jgi:hypothetical protein